MYSGPKEDFYISELKTALEEYAKVDKEMDRVSEDKRRSTRLVKSLLSVLYLKIGEDSTREMLQKFELHDQARPFLYFETPITSGRPKRRKRRKKEIDPSEMLARGTNVRMLSGTYKGATGFIASKQAKQGRKGLDVTYFLSLSDAKGRRGRTSVKHGTLGKTWTVAD
ncbi:MAG: hypothetical protein GXP54_07490 [Deltaproteobacteria bacterium]|nr:hypothetical protein [Deltaproteobacteria bacterium]